MTLGDNIRRLREEKGLSQKDFATLLGVKRSTFAEWERSTEPQATMFFRIAKELGVTMSALLNVDEIPSSSDRSDHSDQNSVAKIPSSLAVILAACRQIESAVLELEAKDTPPADKVIKQIAIRKGKSGGTDKKNK